FLNHTATAATYTLSLHDALPISRQADRRAGFEAVDGVEGRGVLHLSAEEALVAREDEDEGHEEDEAQRDEKAHADQKPPFSLHQDRKSTRLNSSHVKISYAVFCL